jgi:outer membrane protein TolC
VLVLAALPLLLSACALAPQPAPEPSLTVPPAWRTASAGDGAAIDRDWWRAFGDPALDSLVRRALDNNGDLKIARSRLQEYQAHSRGRQRAPAGIEPVAGADARANDRTARRTGRDHFGGRSGAGQL